MMLAIPLLHAPRTPISRPHRPANAPKLSSPFLTNTLEIWPRPRFPVLKSSTSSPSPTFIILSTITTPSTPLVFPPKLLLTNNTSDAAPQETSGMFVFSNQERIDLLDAQLREAEEFLTTTALAVLPDSRYQNFAKEFRTNKAMYNADKKRALDAMKNTSSFSFIVQTRIWISLKNINTAIVNNISKFTSESQLEIQKAAKIERLEPVTFHVNLMGNVGIMLTETQLSSGKGENLSMSPLKVIAQHSKTKPPVSALLDIEVDRLALKELLKNTPFEHDTRISDAISADNHAINLSLVNVVKNGAERAYVETLRGESAQMFVDILYNALTQPWLRSTQGSADPPRKPRSRVRARNLLMRLSLLSGKYPANLFIQNVDLDMNDLHVQTGSSSIYWASYNNRRVILKRVSTGANNAVHAAVMRESLHWMTLQHEYVAEFHGLHWSRTPQVMGTPDMVAPWFENGNAVNFFAKSPSKKAQLPKILRQTAEAIRFLHSQEVVHGDIKGENIFISDTEDARLGDFGLSRCSDPATRQELLRSGGGTMQWMSPELFTDNHASGFNLPVDESKIRKSSDVWAFGMTIYELYSGQRPWGTTPDDEIMDAIREHNLRPPFDLNGHPVMPKIMEQLVSSCWETIPTKRMDMWDVVEALQEFECMP